MNKALSPIEKRRITLGKRGHYTGYACYYCKKRIYKSMGLFLYRNIISCGSCHQEIKGGH